MCMYVIIKYVSIKYIFTCTERIKELVVNSIYVRTPNHIE